MTANELPVPAPSDATNCPEVVPTTARWKIWAICFAAAGFGTFAFEPLLGRQYGCMVGLLIGMSAVAAREIWRQRTATDPANILILIASLVLLAVIAKERNSRPGDWDVMVQEARAYRHTEPRARALKALLDEQGEPQAVVEILPSKGGVRLQVSNLSNDANLPQIRSGMEALGIEHRSAMFYRANGFSLQD